MDYCCLKNLSQKACVHNTIVLNIPNSFSTKAVSEYFSLLVIDVLRMVEKHHKELSKNKKYVAIIGLQPISLPLKSSAPIELNRITNNEHKNNHFCCSLSYLPLDENEFDEISKTQDWSGAETIVIDFTCGLVMSKEHYLHELFNVCPIGKVYGKLSSNKLNRVWQQINSQPYQVAA